MYSKELLLLSDVTILEIITHKTGIKYNIQTHITKRQNIRAIFIKYYNCIRL